MNQAYLALILLLTGCYSNNEIPKYKPIDINELKFKIGDCVSFKADSINTGAAIVIDYSKDEGGIWYGLCFTDYFDTLAPDFSKISAKKIFGRKIESALNNDGFVIGLDCVFVNDSCFDTNASKFHKIGNFRLKSEKIDIGSHAATNDYSHILDAFYRGLKKRKKAPDHYKAHRTKINDYSPEEFFPLKDFIQ